MFSVRFQPDDFNIRSGVGAVAEIFLPKYTGASRSPVTRLTEYVRPCLSLNRRYQLVVSILDSFLLPGEIEVGRRYLNREESMKSASSLIAYVRR